MKSTLKRILKKRIVVLGFIDVLVILWIIWSEGQIQYEPPLDYRDIVYPLDSNIYNTIIVTIIVNILVLIGETKMSYGKAFGNANLILAIIFFIFITCCITWGYYYITTRIGSGVIDECNILFFLPVMLFGKDFFVNIATVINLYVSLCVILTVSCIVYISILFQNEIR
ncbi:hypothetical protein [Sodaliphilus sp.]|uniref:hypothetical protein n=1 Tax=Sodaliphilus sp. TaxID=2815818 RepID=UPI00388CFA21